MKRLRERGFDLTDLPVGAHMRPLRAYSTLTQIGEQLQRDLPAAARPLAKLVKEAAVKASPRGPTQ